MKILIVDDETVALTSLQRLLRRKGHQVAVCDHGQEAIARIRQEEFDVVLLDYLMPEIDGLQVLEKAKPYRPQTEFLMLTAVDEVETVVKALRLGAYDYLVKPVDSERLHLAIEHAFERRALLRGVPGTGKEEMATPAAFAGIITQNPRMKELLAFAEVMARSGNPILVTGESGTGKELLARGIHRAGPNPQGPFVAVNVSAVSEALFESQFFGHIKGAFTGATMDYPGFFEQAHGGTLFLDEIGDLPPALQSKFLRVFEEKTVTRLGDPKPRTVDVRIVSATNIDLDKACQEGRFRLDLIYRLRSIHIALPPLRERRGDIPLLASHFLKEASTRHQREVQGFTPEALACIEQREYPGNIRELAQLVENGVLMADTPMLEPRHLGETQAPVPTFTRTLCSFRENSEIHLAYVLNQTQGNRHETARILGVTLRHVQRMIAEMKKNPRWQTVLGDI